MGSLCAVPAGHSLLRSSYHIQESRRREGKFNMRIPSASPFLCKTRKRFFCPCSNVGHLVSQRMRISPCDLCACFSTTRSWACIFYLMFLRMHSSLCDLCARVFHNVFMRIRTSTWIHEQALLTTCFLRMRTSSLFLYHAYFTLYFRACVIHLVFLSMSTYFTKCCRINRVLLRSAIVHIFDISSHA